MLVMVVEKLPKSLKGALCRWLMEVKSGVFLGNPSQRVRDELWKRLTHRPPLGYVLQLWSANNPQGFMYRQYGSARKQITEFEGLALATTVLKDRRKPKKPEQTNPEIG